MPRKPRYSPEAAAQRKRAQRIWTRLRKKGHDNKFIEVMIDIFNGYDGLDGFIQRRRKVIAERRAQLLTILNGQREVHARLHQIIGVPVEERLRLMDATMDIYLIAHEGGEGPPCQDYASCDAPLVQEHAKAIVALQRAERNLERAELDLERERKTAGTEWLFSKDSILEVLHDEYGFAYGDIALLMYSEQLRDGRAVTDQALESKANAAREALSKYRRQIPIEPP